MKTTLDVTFDTDRDLYVVRESAGYSCLGFDVLIERYNRLAAELMTPALGTETWIGSLPRTFPPNLRGTLQGYAFHMALLDLARRDGRRFTCELSPQLIGLEGHRVEVTRTYDTDRPNDRFIVGRSSGWVPIHIEIKRRDSSGGTGADRLYKSVRDLGRVR